MNSNEMNPMSEMNDTAVRNLQRYLRRLGEETYEGDAILPVPVDGIFDTRTEEALSAFQRIYGLPVTGRADRVTWELLFAEYLRLTELDEVARVDLFPKTPENYVTHLGEESAFVLLVQWLLTEIAVAYDGLEPPSPSGVYDEATEAAVREFQAAQGLPTTGLVDRRTYNRLIRAYEFYAK